MDERLPIGLQGRRALAAGGVVAIFALAGCGSTASTAHDGRTLSEPAYGAYPATTVVGHYSAQGCRRDAGVVTSDARQYLVHSTGAAPAPADLYYIELRRDYLQFHADACDPRGLGTALRRELHPGQRRWLLDNLSQELSQALRSALRA